MVGFHGLKERMILLFTSISFEAMIQIRCIRGGVSNAVYEVIHLLPRSIVLLGIGRTSVCVGIRMLGWVRKVGQGHEEEDQEEEWER